MGKINLQIQQLDEKIKRFSFLKNSSNPTAGWIKAIRTAIGMSMEQLGRKLSISKQAVLDIERREKEDSITLKSLREVARAMDMQLVYAFVPNEGSLDAMIEKRAKELATKIVMRTANTMKLENQANSKKRIEQAIKERTEEIKKELPKILWD
jgi:predicted DNA-binding mobile mystery protein A